MPDTINACAAWFKGEQRIRWLFIKLELSDNLYLCKLKFAKFG